ncbi:hypothetical protein SNE40_005955 [Patella caerulea]|uniref:Sodium/potassium-transporting ATPase subunit beta-1-interacting protein n=1 Tax=Patella caerulea TaxID=87958 RepID=A0AAN8K1G1_PATCE
MGNSSEKCLNRALNTSLIVIFVLQLVGAIERQVFDFLGYMWAPIIGNFFTIACTVIGLFGACQYRPKFIIVFTVWSLLWLGWNMFVICLYLEVGVLSRTRNLYILNIGTKNKSWWLEHGVGCRITNTTWLQESPPPVDASRPIPPEEFVEGCMVQYYYVEVIHAGVQCLLSIIGFIFSVVAIYNLSEEDDTTSPANDELEFVKIRYRSPAHHAYRNNIAFEDINQNDFSSLERPPSYDTTMRDTQIETAAANHYYASDRQSLRSKASTRSKRSTRNTGQQKYEEKREDLPWVQITPSQNTEQIRHFR